MLISYNDDDDPDKTELTMNSNDHYQQEQVDNNSAPIIMNIFDFFKSDFEQVKENEGDGAVWKNRQLMIYRGSGSKTEETLTTQHVHSPKQCDGGHPGDDHNGGEPIGTKQAEGTQPKNNQKGGAINAPTQSAGGQPGDDQEERASKEYKPHETTKKSETSDNGKKSELTKQGTLDGDPTETVRQGPVITGAATHGDDKTKFGTTDSRKMGESTKAGAAGGRNTGAATYPGGITVGTAGVGFTTTAAAQPRQTWDLGSKESGERVLTTKAGAQGGRTTGAATHPGGITEGTARLGFTTTAAAHPGAKSMSGYHESSERGATTKAGAQGGRTTGAATHPGGITEGKALVGFTTTAAAQPRQT
ncbi:unnamed protein product, partial [Rotaria socialis]